MQLIRHNDRLRKRLENYSNVPPSSHGAVVALGNFDGIHQGHRQVLQHTIKLAKESGKPSASLTFEPHPMQALMHHPTPMRITNFRQKFRLIEKVGIDQMYAIHFDNEFSTTSAHHFIEHILLNHLHISHIVIGDDFIFGHQRSGNSALLNDFSQQYGFEFTQISPVGNDKCSDRFSSSAIRAHLKAGHIQRASEQLGHDFVIEGRVIDGDHRGRTIGVPTANIRLGEYIRPLFGVYTCHIMVDGEHYKGICNIGNKPTVGGKEDLLEVNIFNFNRDIYGKRIAVKLVDFIRIEQKFSEFNELKNQINKDINIAQERLK